MLGYLIVLLCGILGAYYDFGKGKASLIGGIAMGILCAMGVMQSISDPVFTTLLFPVMAAGAVAALVLGGIWGFILTYIIYALSEKLIEKD